MALSNGDRVKVVKEGAASFGRTGTVTAGPGTDARYTILLDPETPRQIRALEGSLQLLEPARREPEPREPPRAADLLWTADASRPFAEEWSAGNAFDVRGGDGTYASDPAWLRTTRIVRTEHAGRKAWKMTVVDGDRDKWSPSNQRTEMGQGSPARKMPDGVERRMQPLQEYWLAYELLIPESYRASRTWCALNQIKGANSSGNGPMGVGFQDNRLRFDKSISQEQTSTNMAKLWESEPIKRDIWLKVLINVKWSLGADGFFAFYVDLADGRGLVERIRKTGWTLKKNPDPAIGQRLGIYREGIRGTHSVYFAGVCCGKTRDAVEQFAFAA